MGTPRKVVEHPPGSITDRLNVLLAKVHPQHRGSCTALEVAKLPDRNFSQHRPTQV